MLEGVPMRLPLVFIAATVTCGLFLMLASPRRRVLLVLCGGWMALQAALAIPGFYTVTNTLPPRMALAIGPPLVAIVAMFATLGGRAWMDTLDVRTLTWLHVVRVPVEWGLHALFAQGLVPELMTYEGRNFDILSGLSAPIVAWLAFRKGGLDRTLLLVWNLVCMGLLINIVFYGILSVPTPLQQFGSEQPNVGLLYFPFIWLPAFIVPIVLFAHAVVLRRMLLHGR
ncbi:MAG: hypothetical protein IPG69_03435 [Flavobacteriales bacterium]|nr:hypothetical protein [Flavobacteriales bacterium]